MHATATQTKMLPRWLFRVIIRTLVTTGVLSWIMLLFLSLSLDSNDNATYKQRHMDIEPFRVPRGSRDVVINPDREMEILPRLKRVRSIKGQQIRTVSQKNKESPENANQGRSDADLSRLLAEKNRPADQRETFSKKDGHEGSRANRESGGGGRRGREGTGGDRREEEKVKRCPGAVYRQGTHPHTWQKPTNSSYIYSAYLDTRESVPLVRVVGIHITLKRPRWCQLFYEGLDRPVVTPLVSSDIPEKHQNVFDVPDYKCYLENKQKLITPCGITLTEDRTSTPVGFVPVISEANTKHPKTSFTACIPPLYKFESTTILTESIELKRLFGAEYFIIYVHSVNEDVEQYLEYYSSIGVAKIVPWLLPNVNVHYYAQLAALTDCMLQSMYTSKYVSFSDVDEVIVPTNHSNWTDMIKSIDKVHAQNNGVYLLRNSFVVIDHKDSLLDGLPDNVVGLAQRYKILSLLKRYRSEKVWPPAQYSKCIINPRCVHTVGIHEMHGLFQNCKSLDVDPSHGFLWHYRHNCVMCTRIPRVQDDKMLLFANKIAQGIFQVHSAMNRI